MERIRRSWQLVRSSWAVLRADKELLLYPVASGIVTFIAFAVVFLIWLGSGGLDRLDDQSFGGIIDLLLIFIVYFVTSTIVVFFNSALIAAANIRLEGGDPTLSDGFRIAFSHIGHGAIVV